MRRLAFATVLALAALPAAAQTDASVIPASAPHWLPMGEAVAQAKAQDKILLVHSYATWCGWCAKFDHEVYTDSTVQAYVAAHFVPTRLDLEGTAEVPFFEHTVSMAELGNAFGVTGTPTTVFVAPDGQPISKFPGYTDTATFLLVLRYVAEGAYDTESFEQFKARLNGEAPPLQFDVPAISPGR